MALLHSPLVFLLLNVLFISVVPQILTSSPRTEAEALVKWKSSLLPAASLSSWSSSHLENLCNWTGITCNSAGTVSKLNVSGQDLNGTLAHFSFSSFPNLSSPSPGFQPQHRITLEINCSIFSVLIPTLLPILFNHFFHRHFT